MTRRVWFCYELDHSNKPTPVIYYDDLPTGKGKRQIVQSHEITEVVAEFSFYSLQALYPLISQQESNVDITTADVVKYEWKEVEMARQANGYLTKTGKFFEDEKEADLWDARYELDKAAATAAVHLGVHGEYEVKAAVEALVSFINQNTEIIEEYISARRRVKAEQEDDVVDGQPTEDNTTDDSSIRCETSVEVAEEPLAETLVATARDIPEPKAV